MSSANAAAFAALDAWTARVRDLEHFSEDVAAEAGRVALAESKRTIAAGTDPYGKPWAPREDGAKALATVGTDLRLDVVGKTIFIRLPEGSTARHHYGWARGGKTRSILPKKTIPDPMARAIKNVVERRFRDRMGASR